MAMAATKNKKKKKSTPHTSSALVTRAYDGRAPATAVVVLAAEIARAGGDARGVPLTKKLSADVRGLQNVVTELWHDDALSRSLGDVLSLVDDSLLKNAGNLAHGCRADIVVVSGHGAFGHLADASGRAEWPLDEVAAEISARLPTLGALVLAACAGDGDAAVVSSLRALARERGVAIVGMVGDIDADVRDRIVRHLVDRAVHAGEKVVVGDAVRSAVSLLDRDLRRRVVLY